MRTHIYRVRRAAYAPRVEQAELQEADDKLLVQLQEDDDKLLVQPE